MAEFSPDTHCLGPILTGHGPFQNADTQRSARWSNAGSGNPGGSGRSSHPVFHCFGPGSIWQFPCHQPHL